jgi:hypothetical protein
METLGQDTDMDAVVLLLDKAEVLLHVWEALGRKPYRPSEGIRVAVDSGLSQDDRELRAAAIGGLVTALGGKESTDPDKLFSTPSADGAPATVGTGGGFGGGADAPASPTKAKKVEVEGSVEELRDALSQLQAKMVALEIDRAGHAPSEAGSESDRLAAALERQSATLEKQTEALKAALTERGPRSTVTSVRADIQWMNLTDDLSDEGRCRFLRELRRQLCNGQRLPGHVFQGDVDRSEGTLPRVAVEVLPEHLPS